MDQVLTQQIQPSQCQSLLQHFHPQHQHFCSIQILTIVFVEEVVEDLEVDMEFPVDMQTLEVVVEVVLHTVVDQVVLL